MTAPIQFRSWPRCAPMTTSISAGTRWSRRPGFSRPPTASRGPEPRMSSLPVSPCSWTRRARRRSRSLSSALRSRTDEFRLGSVNTTASASRGRETSPNFAPATPKVISTSALVRAGCTASPAIHKLLLLQELFKQRLVGQVVLPAVAHAQPRCQQAQRWLRCRRLPPMPGMPACTSLSFQPGEAVSTAAGFSCEPAAALVGLRSLRSRAAVAPWPEARSAAGH